MTAFITIACIFASIIACAMSYLLGASSRNNFIRKRLYDINNEALRNVKILAITTIIICLALVVFGFGTIVTL